MDLPVLTLDFETYYESRGYTLKKYTTMEYITHEQFKVHGVGVMFDGVEIWFTDMDAFRHFLSDVGENVTLLCHNTGFDGFILHHHFNYHPARYADTQLMSRGMFVGQSASLKALCQRLWPNDDTMRKGEELINSIDKRTLTSDEAHELGGYCLQDVRLTRAAYDLMEAHYPDDELAIIDLTLQFFCAPLLKIDRAMVEKTRDDATNERNRLIKASGLSETKLSSNKQFAEWIRAQGLEVPRKVSLTTGEETDALGKSDLEFQKLRKANPELEHAWAGRIASKSVGEITRAKRFLETADMCGDYMPVPLRYYGAHTGRYGGCLAGNTDVIATSLYSHCGYYTKPITEVTQDELVWDGTAFVEHDGVVFSGMKEVITHDGITGTPEHIVFTRNAGEKTLAQARADGDSLQVPPEPCEHELALARAMRANHEQGEGPAPMPGMRRPPQRPGA